MTDTKKIEKEVEAPLFMVTMAPGFFDGSVMHEPGSKISWSVPDGHDEKKNGKHWAQHAPPSSFQPLNDEAVALQERAKAARAKRPAPVAVGINPAMEELVQKLLIQNGEMLAELRRQSEERAEADKKKK